MGHVSAKYTKQTHEQLDEISNQTGIPMCRIVEQLVDEYYQKHHGGELPRNDPDALGDEALQTPTGAPDAELSAAETAFQL